MPWRRAAWCISTGSIGRDGLLARMSSFGHGRWAGFFSRSSAADRCASLHDDSVCRGPHAVKAYLPVGTPCPHMLLFTMTYRQVSIQPAIAQVITCRILCWPYFHICVDAVHSPFRDRMNLSVAARRRLRHGAGDAGRRGLQH